MDKIGLQLYTIKDVTEKDFLGTLKKVAEIGYDGVEFAGYYGVEAEELKRVLVDNNLVAIGTHFVIEELEEKDKLADIIDYAKKIDCPTIICPGLFSDRANSKEAFLSAAKIFNEVGVKCRDNGLSFVYHIHGHEFDNYDGKNGMEILIENTDPEFVSFELDTYYVKLAGLDPVEFYRQYGERCSHLHFKDMTVDNKNTEVGEGIIDFGSLLKEADKYDIEWIIIEQEDFTIKPIESVIISLNNIKNMID